MAIGELVTALLGWLGDFVEWVFSWVPRYEIVHFNEMGVIYFMGRKPKAIGPGVHWYCPALTEIEVREVVRSVLDIQALTLETNNGVPVQVGMVISYTITDIYKFQVETTGTVEAMSEVSEGALRDIVLEHTWEQLTKPADEGTMFEQKLKRRLDAVLGRFGVEVETARPTHQVRLRSAHRLFTDSSLMVNNNS